MASLPIIQFRHFGKPDKNIVQISSYFLTFNVDCLKYIKGNKTKKVKFFSLYKSENELVYLRIDIKFTVTKLHLIQE